MNDQERFQQIELTIKPISPFFIGAASDYSPLDVKYQGLLYLIDENTWAEHLASISLDLIEDYMDHVNRWMNEEIPKIDRDMSESEKKRIRQLQRKKKNILRTFLEETKDHLIPRQYHNDWTPFLESISRRKQIYFAPNDKQFIRNAHGKYYIPGSSLKGVIRTAILWKMFQTYKEETKNNLLTRLTYAAIYSAEKIADKTKGKEYMDKEVLKQSLADFLFKNPQYQPDRGPHTDLLKTVYVSDSSDFSYEQTNKSIEIIYPKSYNKKGKKFTKKVCCEFDGKICLQMTVTLDLYLLEQYKHNSRINKFPLPFHSVQDIINILSALGEAVWKYERDYFAKQSDLASVTNFYKEETPGSPCFRIGYGSGLSGTTLFTLLSTGQRESIRDIIAKGQKKGLPAPKTRRLVEVNGELLPMGWMQFSVAEE